MEQGEQKMKSITTISLDTELLAEARIRRMNLSNYVNESLRIKLEMVKKEIDTGSAEEKIISLKADLATAQIELDREKLKKKKNMKIPLELRFVDGVRQIKIKKIDEETGEPIEKWVRDA